MASPVSRKAIQARKALREKPPHTVDTPPIRVETVGPLQNALKGRTAKGGDEDGPRKVGTGPQLPSSIGAPAALFAVLKDLKAMAGEPSWERVTGGGAGSGCPKSSVPIYLLTAGSNGEMKDLATSLASGASPRLRSLSKSASPVISSYGVTSPSLARPSAAAAGESRPSSLAPSIRPGGPLGHVLGPSCLTSWPLRPLSVVT